MYRCCSYLLLATLLGVLATRTAVAQDFDELARKTVATSVNIQPGDVVVVSGGQHNIALMEALAVEAQKAGGLVTMFLNTDRFTRSLFAEVDEKHLGQEPTFFAEWLKHIDVLIGVPEVENPKAVYADIPEERSAKVYAGNQVIFEMINEARFRLAFIGYPTEAEAELNQMELAAYEQMHWAAVNADYAAIAQNGEKLKGLLQGTKTVRITSPSGTDLTFSTGNRPIIVDDGIVTAEEAKAGMFLTRIASLPGGQVFMAPIETSANGNVVIPRDRCKYAPLEDVSFTFKDGVLHNFKAGEGAACFDEVMAPYSGPKDRFASFSIGLNPALKVVEDGADYRPVDAAGMVTIGIGDNELLGGENKSRGGFGFPVVKATVTVDGKVVVKDGKLMLGMVEGTQ